MAYLTTFYWGWLLTSVLLGLAMGWISVVQHGEGVSKNMKRWLARSKSDEPVRYIPEIAFAQSKDYVYRVMANFRMYEMMYDENLKRR